MQELIEIPRHDDFEYNKVVKVLPDKVVEVLPDEVVLDYTEDYADPLSGNDFTTISDNYRLGERLGVGPKVLLYGDYDLTLEKVTPLIAEDKITLPLTLQKEFIRSVDEKITTLHEAGYFHGDLNEENLGYRLTETGIEAVLLDLDTMLPIKGAPLYKYNQLLSNYSEIFTVSELVAYDFTNWRQGLEWD